MKSTAFVLSALGTLLLGGATLSAQGRGNNSGRIPPGQQPRAGQCRVWYDNVPPGRQPAAMDCRSAESIAARDRSARVIYGSGTNRSSGAYGSYDPYYGNSGNSGSNHDNRNGGYGRAYPRGGNGGYYNVALSNGFTDGEEKGREDVSKRRTYDPSRHSRFRDGNHLYQREYGSEEQYKGEYRQGFIDGYDSAFRGSSNIWTR